MRSGAVRASRASPLLCAGIARLRPFWWPLALSYAPPGIPGGDHLIIYQAARRGDWKQVRNLQRSPLPFLLPSSATFGLCAYRVELFATCPFKTRPERVNLGSAGRPVRSSPLTAQVMRRIQLSKPASSPVWDFHPILEARPNWSHQKGFQSRPSSFFR